MSTQPPVVVHTLAQLVQNNRWSVELLHPQDGNLLVWSTRGQGVVTLHGVRRGFGTHNAIFIPKGQIWSLEFGRQTMGLAVQMPASVSGRFPDSCQLLRIQDGLVQSELTGLIEDMRREIQQDRPFVNDALQAQSQMLAIWLRRQIEAAGTPARPKAAHRLVHKFCDLASASYQDGLTMGDYAEQLDVTPTHLTRVCREVSGATAADVLTQCVLHRARHRLAETDTPIKEVAETLGFNSAAYFTRFIQQHCKTTPSDLRRQAQTSTPFRAAA